MRRWRFVVAVISVLVGATLARAQLASPLQFQLIDVNQAIAKFNATTVIQKPTMTVPTFNFPSFYPKIALAPFPSKTPTPQSFTLPSTSNPIQGAFPFMQSVPFKTK